MYVLEHGYCRSLYVKDPDGMICEFTVDHPDVEKINATRSKDAHAELKRWLGGNYNPTTCSAEALALAQRLFGGPGQHFTRWPEPRAVTGAVPRPVRAVPAHDALEVRAYR